MNGLLKKKKLFSVHLVGCFWFNNISNKIGGLEEIDCLEHTCNKPVLTLSLNTYHEYTHAGAVLCPVMHQNKAKSGSTCRLKRQTGKKEEQLEKSDYRRTWT